MRAGTRKGKELRRDQRRGGREGARRREMERYVEMHPDLRCGRGMQFFEGRAKIGPEEPFAAQGAGERLVQVDRLGKRSESTECGRAAIGAKGGGDLDFRDADAFGFVALEEPARSSNCRATWHVSKQTPRWRR